MENKLIQKINSLVGENPLVRIFYGKDGKIWNEEHDVLGRIGRSTGIKKVPLLLENKKSEGGCAILLDCIVGLKVDGVFFGFMRGYKLGYEVFPIVGDDELLSNGYTHSLYVNGEGYANCKSESEAIGLGRFMCGLSDSKRSNSLEKSATVALDDYLID